MARRRHLSRAKAWLLGATMLAGLCGPALADIDDGKLDNEIQQPLPTGQYISPTAATGATLQTLNPGLADHPDFRAGFAVKTVVSPDGGTLLVLTSGFNNLNYSSGTNLGNFEPSASNEYVFVYDIAGANKTSPKQVQVIQVPNTYVGLVFAPDGRSFYVSGGVDDQVYGYSNAAGSWTLASTIKLGHNGIGIGLAQAPNAAGLAISPSGNTLVVANIYNDSISVIDTASKTVRFEYDLRPYNTTPATGSGQAGGETPFNVAIKGDGIVYVSSMRDREVVVVDIAGAQPALVTRIALPGNPNSMVFDGRPVQRLLFVAQDNADQVAVIDTTTNRVIEQIDAIAPPGVLAAAERYTGAASNGLAISPDHKRLYVTNGGANSLAVVSLEGGAPHRVIGLIPTGFYPNSVATSADGGALYVVNGKSVPGRNPGHLTGATGRITYRTYPGGNALAATKAAASNQYILQLQQAGLLALPTPGANDLPHLTRIVAANNHYAMQSDANSNRVMAALRQKIRHVIYIVKENRTFDQVLGDLNNGSNGDPKLAIFGRRITPNFHRLARDFVTLDNFMDSGEVSGNGWPWSTSARETDMTVKTIPLNYGTSPSGTSSRGAPYDAEGQNRTVDVGIATLAGRQAALPIYTATASTLPGGAANLLPGTNDDGAPDGPGGRNKQTGYIWDAALRAGLTVRNYGFLIDLTRYFVPAVAIPLEPNPFKAGLQVAYPVNPSLIPLTDIYYRGYDNAFPDFYRVDEWAREFKGYVRNRDLPSLSLVRLMHDHMGAFGSAIAGINTPETQQADNDLSVGRLIETVATSPYKDDTLVFVIEDDAQDGPDHVDAHRSTAYVVGPYVKHHAVVSTRYSTVNMLRTIEDVLGLDHLNLNDAYQPPMADVFDLNQRDWSYRAVASAVLRGTDAARADVQFAEEGSLAPAQPASYWAKATEGFDWSAEDRVPAVLFNQIVWDGLMEGQPYPLVRSGLDLRGDGKPQ